MKKILNIYVDETDQGQHLVKVFTLSKKDAINLCEELREHYDWSPNIPTHHLHTKQ